MAAFMLPLLFVYTRDKTKQRETNFDLLGNGAELFIFEVKEP